MSTVQSAEPQAAVAIVRARDTDSILLIRRTERPDDPWSGHWSYPGGRRESFDATPLQTALRELHEECGVELFPASLERTLEPVVARRRRGPFMLVAPFIFHVDEALPTTVDPEEAVEAVWMPLSEWQDATRHRLRPVPNMPENCLFPAVDWCAHPVWGFTYRLTTDWLGLFAAGSLEAAGAGVARQVLDFLLASGLRLKSGWQPVATHSGANQSADPMIQTTRAAVVEGVIPASEVLAHFSRPVQAYPAVNLIEVRPELVRVIGLGFEEYLIRAE
jgi:ADP-ribose pyrophosphatase YjhB (NUDIX family)